MRAFDFLRDPVAGWWDRARHFELPRPFIAPCACATAVLAAIAGWTAIDAAALRSSNALQARAEVRVEGLQHQIDSLRISRALREASARRIRRLRAIRQSGLRTADRIARLGSAVADGAWTTSISSQASSPVAIKGYAAGLDRLAAVVANIVRDPSTGRLTAVRFSSDAHAPERLTFELQVEGAEHGGSR